MQITFIASILAAAIAAAAPVQVKKTCQLTREYLSPARIVLVEGEVKDADNLVAHSDTSFIFTGTSGQAMVNTKGCAMLRNVDGQHASVILDFGHELHGGIRIVTGKTKGHEALVRITLGESVSEAMSDIEPDGATNDHAIRDFTAELPWVGVREFGNSGFRFARIELLDDSKTLALREVNAIEIGSGYPRIGSFSCSDSRLNEIWEVGRHTVKCNMQEYLWDGIKRDRLIWVGDMYPEVMTILNSYGTADVVPRSLDFVTENYKLPAWINGMCPYSIWWLLIQARWYEYSGDLAYLTSCKPYLTGLVKQLCDNVAPDGRETLEGGRFLDWPSKADTAAVNTGLHALMIMAMKEGSSLCRTIGENELAANCDACLERLESRSTEISSSFFAAGVDMTRPGRKQAVALMKLAGMIDSAKAADALMTGRSKGFSTFYGYFMLEALAESGEYADAMALISEFWGGMIDLGATSFWEDFDISWIENAGRIDEIPSEDKVDVHRNYGGYCYKSYRHSLCHGWASGPTAWLSRHVLGLSPASCGQKTVSVDPHLGNLEWAEGTYPTPFGTVRIKVTRTESGKVTAAVRGPKGVRFKAADGVILKKLK